MIGEEQHSFSAVQDNIVWGKAEIFRGIILKLNKTL
jgi:hypothetical protein